MLITGQTLIKPWSNSLVFERAGQILHHWSNIGQILANVTCILVRHWSNDQAEQWFNPGITTRILNHKQLVKPSCWLLVKHWSNPGQTVLCFKGQVKYCITGQILVKYWSNSPEYCPTLVKWSSRALVQYWQPNSNYYATYWSNTDQILVKRFGASRTGSNTETIWRDNDK